MCFDHGPVARRFTNDHSRQADCRSGAPTHADVDRFSPLAPCKCMTRTIGRPDNGAWLARLRSNR
jgi:hypothetical protein